jgi:tetratricopeptide (TPR) repeat protein
MAEFSRTWFAAAAATGIITLSACAIPTRQTDAFVKDPPRDIPVAATITGVPFVLQDKNYCGPASMAMVMAFAGNAVGVAQLAEQVYTPGKEGTLQADLVGAARRNGMMAVEIRGMSALLREIAAGHPVLTLENLGLSWYPRWHYAVVYGYDLSEPTITLHSGSHEADQKSMRKFERCWEDSGDWAIVVLRPGQLAATADDLAHTVAAAGLEQLGQSAEAERAYLSILSKWPESLGALIGMGNLKDAAGSPKESARYLDRAVKAHPDSSIAWHNLATAQGGAGQVREACRSASIALSLVEGAELVRYRESLKEWQGRKCIKGSPR